MKKISESKKFENVVALVMQEMREEKQQEMKRERRLGVILCVIPLAHYRQVANELWKKTDEQLLVSGRNYVEKVGLASTIFVAPFTPALPDCTTALDDFEQAMLDAAGGGTVLTATKNVKREVVMNLMIRLSGMVESVANDSANAATGAVVIIETGGMRVKPVNVRGGQQWAVYAGPVHGTLKLTAPALKRGAHQWAYTTTPSDDTSWVDWNPDNCTEGKTIITDLGRGSLVYCRHRTLTAAGVSDWEGHDPVIVP